MDVGMRVIIADDHRIVLDGVAALLRSAGHMILASCTDGEQVLRALEAEKPDALILDVQMPGLTGLEILRLLKKQRSPLRIILLTSSINNFQALEAIRLGVDGLS